MYKIYNIILHIGVPFNVLNISIKNVDVLLFLMRDNVNV